MRLFRGRPETGELPLGGTARGALGVREATRAVEQPPEQLLYARLLDMGTSLGLLVLVLSFAAYLMDWLPPRVLVHELPTLWHQPVDEFQRLTGAPQGWAWLAQVQHGDLAGLVGIALLAGSTLPCLLALVPLYARAGNRAYMAICLAEAAVLLLAASGVLATGH
jgi:hypothetical protein